MADKTNFVKFSNKVTCTKCGARVNNTYLGLCSNCLP